MNGVYKMMNVEWLREQRRSAGLLQVLALMFWSIWNGNLAVAQPVEGGPAVRFEIRAETYDWNPLDGVGTNHVAHGPELGSITVERVVGDLDPKLIEAMLAVTSSDGIASVDMHNAAEVLAQRIDGHIFGGGVTAYLDVWIKGGDGMRFIVNETMSGLVEADYPEGLGRIDSYGPGAVASGVNGSGYDWDSIAVQDQIVGQTSGERDFDGETYSFATTLAYDMRGGIWQSLDICFFGCATHHYFARGDMGGDIEVIVPRPVDFALLACFTDAFDVPRDLGRQIDQGYIYAYYRFASSTGEIDDLRDIEIREVLTWSGGGTIERPILVPAPVPFELSWWIPRANPDTWEWTNVSEGRISKLSGERAWFGDRHGTYPIVEPGFRLFSWDSDPYDPGSEPWVMHQTYEWRWPGQSAWSYLGEKTITRSVFGRHHPDAPVGIWEYYQVVDIGDCRKEHFVAYGGPPIF